MNKIKVIDLLNMISKGEEVPKKIKYYGEEFVFTGYDSASKNYYNEREDLFEVLDGSILNDEVEILEEEKKIPEKLKSLNNVGNSKDLCEFEDKQQLNNHLLKDKLNEVIQYLKSKGE